MAKRKKKDPQPHFVDNVVIEQRAQSEYNHLIANLGLEAAEQVLCRAHRLCMDERRRRAGLPKGS